MKWIILLSLLSAGTLAAVFMTPEPGSGDLLSFEPLRYAFANGSPLESIKNKTPGRVLTVTGNSAARVAGKALGSATHIAGPIIDSAQEEGKEGVSTLIPDSNEQKREKLIAELEGRIHELEQANRDETERLQDEMEDIISELKAVKEDNNLLQSIVETLRPENSECECAP